MTNVRQSNDYEIDLLDHIEILWNSKWLIVSAVVISVLITFGYQSFQPKPDFIATTKIKPISSIEAEAYRKLNDSVEFFYVPSSLLLNLYFEQLDERIVFEEAIKKFELLKATDYKSESDFNEAVTIFASRINVSKESSDERKIEGEYNNEYKWKQFLKYVKASANQNVRKHLLYFFENSLTIAKLKRDNELEDIGIQIENALSDYDKETTANLAYLREQAALARELEIATPSILNDETLFYMRGYESIEKEIELIESRSNKEAFISGLLELKQEQRALKQDKMLKRAKTIFFDTPIFSNDGFSAASMDVEATEFKIEKKQLRTLTLAAIIGLCISLFYVYILNFIRKRKG